MEWIQFVGLISGALIAIIWCIIMIVNKKSRSSVKTEESTFAPIKDHNTRANSQELPWPERVEDEKIRRHVIRMTETKFSGYYNDEKIASDGRQGKARAVQ